MGDLSKNFSRSEFACKCGCGADAVEGSLVRSLQALRDLVGVLPVHVTSGVRCVAHNRAVGGATSSYHLTGEAADIVIADLSLLEMFGYAHGVPEFLHGGIGLYPASDGQTAFIHVDVGPQRRWCRVEGKYGPLSWLTPVRV